MSFPWAVQANTKTICKRNRLWLPAWYPRRKSLTLLVSLALSGTVSVLHAPAARAEPPSPTQLPLPAANFGNPAQVAILPSNNPAVMNIVQYVLRTKANFDRFDIGRDAAVLINQTQGSSSVLLAQIDKQYGPSQIFGRLSANGQVYLLNQSGILFGKGAQIDVHTLVASALNINEEVINLGLANVINQEQVSAEGRAAFAGTNPESFVTIESGAVLKSAEGGSIMIFAPKIENHGDISTPGGQAILAASRDTVYLANFANPDMRGLLVEVNTGGDVTNIGKIVAERGNVTLLGYAVNQNGLARATTSVELNGSVHLLARDNVIVQPITVNENGKNVTAYKPTANEPGKLTLGQNSLTEVVPDNIAQTAVDAQKQPISQIALMGREVTLKTGARVVAPGGDVNVTAQAGAVPSTEPIKIVMESGSLIDVSGLTAVVPMEHNIVAVELRSQLADSPLQRNGPLYQQTVYIDARKGTPLANVAEDIAKIQRPLDERLSAGGKVTIRSQGTALSPGAVVMHENAVIDVSGGAVRYQDGYLNTTQLISQGKVYDIGDADPNRAYDGIFGVYKVQHKKWGVSQVFNIFGPQGSNRFEAGYVEGKDAGTVKIDASVRDLQGTIRGETMAGRYQYLPPTSLDQDESSYTRRYDQAPLGGELILGADTTLRPGEFNLQSLTELHTDGMNRMRVYANGKITAPTDMNLVLAPGGELSLTAPSIDLKGDITVHGGHVEINANLEGAKQGAKLGKDAQIDVSGQWVNDSATLYPGTPPPGPAFINGGTVTVTAVGNVALESGSVINADGGAHLQHNGKLKFGDGGGINIASTPYTATATATDAKNPTTLRLDGDLHAYSFAKGGSLSLTGAGFRIAGAADAAPANTVPLSPAFFQSGGFKSYNLKATHTGITLAADTEVTLRAQNRVLNADFWSQPTGTDLNRLATVGFLPDDQRQPVSLALSFARANYVNVKAGRVELEQGARIHADPGAGVSLTSDTQLMVNGTIAAPAGDIKLTLTGPAAPDNEHGFDRSQAIWLGPQGRLLAGAHFQSTPDGSGRGLRTGKMHNGGTVSIVARRGYFVASPDSVIDVSGTTQTLDISQGLTVTPTPVNGAAGTVDLLAAEGMVLNGTLRGAPGEGAGAAGGALNITLNEEGRTAAMPPDNPYLTGSRDIVLTATKSLTPEAGKDVPDSLNGIVWLDPNTVTAGGFDQVALRPKSASPDQTAARIILEGDVRLAPARRLVLNAPVLESYGGHAELAAAYIRLGATDGGTPSATEGGNGSMLVRGQHVDLVGNMALRGFGPGGSGVSATETAPVRIESEGDIRLIGEPGRLNSAVDMVLKADQIYAATTTDFTVHVQVTRAGKPAGKITIESGGESAPPLSAGSKLTLNAANIEQLGTLRAPFGQINLDASEKLVLGAGSITSVSGAGQLVPFGTTDLGGQDWLYTGASIGKVYRASPEKRVTLKAPQITLDAGSVVDVTGGGDLLAREHLPGTGGSTDILQNVFTKGPLKGTVNTAFALVPTQNNPFGSHDPFLSEGSSVQPGDTIHLAGGGPIAAGEYAMLPAGYALLPGAYLVTPLAKTDSPMPGQALPQFDGSAIVAGQRGVAGTGSRESLWSAYRVESGTQVRNRAAYLESRADTFFAANAGRLNRDAGQLVIDASTRTSIPSQIILGGTFARNATGGRGSEIDILANNLAVVAQRSGRSDRVELLATELNSLNTESLLLGATRQQQGADLALDVRATEVTVESGAAVAAPEVMLAAKNKVSVAGDATITARAADGDGVHAPKNIQLTDDSALVRISSGEQVRVQRKSSPGATLGTPGMGNLDIASGADLHGARSITLDASGNAVVDGKLRTDNGSLSLAAARISLVGDNENVRDGGLVLSNDRLKEINARDLILNSHSTIDLYGKIVLDVNRLALDSAGLAGYNNAGQGVSLNATDTIVLSNRSGVGFNQNPSAPPLGSGTLGLTAREVTLGEGNFAVRGFSDTAIAATQQIIARPETDTPAKLQVAGNLALEAPRITASPGADMVISTKNATDTAIGKITLTAPVVPANLAPVTDLGGKLEIVATAIEHAGRIELPSGVVSLHATEGGVNIAPNALIDVSGRDLTFADLTVGSPGGQVALMADAGGISVGAGARIDVSGATSGGDAGKISLSAPKGEVRLDAAAQLAAAARAGAKAGSFALDAQKLINDFSALNATLNTAGFTNGRQFRLRQGDIAIAASDVILAHDLRLAADTGSIDVRGRIDASGEQAGRVDLYADKDITLYGSARIDAHAQGAGEKGGEVTLASRAGQLDLQATDDPNAKTIDVSGTKADGTSEDTGVVHLRALRVRTNGAADDNNVAIKPIAANIGGAQRIDIEAYKIYTPTVGLNNTAIINTALIDDILRADTTAFMANAGNIKNALGVGADSRFHLLAGVEIQSPGDLTLETGQPLGWDLLAWRDGGEPGVLTLRAAGNLNFMQGLSDGVAFEPPPQPGNEGLFTARDVVQMGPSWSYRLAGGADLSGADSLALRRDIGDSDDTGNISLAFGAKVRTGTGNIELAAAHDIRFADNTAAVYTTGENRGVGAMPGIDSNLNAEVIKELFLKGDFLHNGGNIRMTAGRDIIGAKSNQFTNYYWLPRVGSSVQLPDGSSLELPVAWAINIAEFQQNIGALGGGNVTLTASGNIDQLSAVIPTTGQPVDSTPGTAPSIAGGGDLHIETGGDIRGGVFYLAQGQADIAAGGSVTKATDQGVYPILALGDGQYTVRARKDLAIESVVNPTMLDQNPNAYYPGIISSPIIGKDSYFFTYTENSAVRLESIAGDTDIAKGTSTYYYPGTLSARSLQGDINIGNSFTLIPAPRGDLELLAKGNIAAAGITTVTLLDTDPRLLPSIVSPTTTGGELVSPDAATSVPVSVHQGDTQPVRIVAQTGTIGSLFSKLVFVLPKQAHIYAGEDVRNLVLNIQHVDAGDISVVEAGKSILFPIERSGTIASNDASQKFEITGPGQFYAIAGKDVNLGASSGIITSGDTQNPALADSGASITVMAGVQPSPDYAAFIQKYLADSSAYNERLAKFMTGLGSTATGVDGFRALPLAQQRKFILEVLFNELRASGIAAANTKRTQDYEPGYTAIKTLFPGEGYGGDVKSFLSQITTRDGGDINLVVPGGLINAGVADTTTITKKAADLGIAALRDGDINALVHGDFLVNESRVFALDGGDILVWSSTGDINAGKGAKTALSIPPPTITRDDNGNPVVEFPLAVEGSGIRATVATPGREPGNVYLIAPVGVIDAGDAGIGSDGNLTLVATTVVNADNIQVGGIATGVPTDSGGLAAGLAGVGDIAATANKMAEDAVKNLANNNDSGLSNLDVQVTGYGEDQDGDSVEIRKRKPKCDPEKDRDKEQCRK